jgi:hypothetical protein
MTEPSKWAVKHQRAWDAALATLREAGWQVEMTGLAAPVQLEGVLPCGEQFYFRSRHDEVLLAVGGEDPADAAPWEQWVKLRVTPRRRSLVSPGPARAARAA